MEATEIKVIHWILAVPFALVLSISPASCVPEPEPIAAYMPDPVLVTDQQAEAEALEMAKIYDHMSDAERMKGVVYEP